TTGLVHPGHLTVLPIKLSGALSLALQAGQTTVTGMMNLPAAEGMADPFECLHLYSGAAKRLPKNTDAAPSGANRAFVQNAGTVRDRVKSLHVTQTIEAVKGANDFYPEERPRETFWPDLSELVRCSFSKGGGTHSIPVAYR